MAALALGGARRGRAAQLTKGGYGTMIVSVGAETASFNPNLDAVAVTQFIAPNLFNRLVALDHDFALIPDLARGWEVSDDGLRYTFVLESSRSATSARGASWHDGEPVTARDVQYTFEQILATPAALANAALAAVADVSTDTVTGANGADVVVFTLSQPDPALLTTLASNGTYILPAHIYQGSDWTTNPANQEPVGSGPFQFLSATPGTTVDLGAHHTYFGTGPYLDQVIYQLYTDPARAQDALIHGEIDLIAGPLAPAGQFPLLTQAPGIMIADQLLPVLYLLGFNLRREALANPEVRTALAAVLDRAAIVASALSGLGRPATSVAPAPGPPDPAAAPPTLTAGAAMVQLDAAGSPAAGGTRLALTLPYPSDDATLTAIATAVVPQFAALDVEVTLVPMPTAEWRERLASGDFDLTVVRQGVGGTSGAIAPLVASDGSANVWGYANPELDAALAAAVPADSAGDDAPDAAAIETMLRTDPPVVPLVVAAAPIPLTTRFTGLPYGPDGADIAMNRFSSARPDREGA